MIAKGGLTSESAYPYTARTGVCKTSIPVSTIPGAGRVPPGDEQSLQGYVAQGPVLALIDASHPSFANYHGGIYSEPACSTDNPTRAVLIVGYGTSSGQDYWLVKNSMGSAWGSSGYIFIPRNNNSCGIASFALAVSNDPLPRALPKANRASLRPSARGISVSCWLICGTRILDASAAHRLTRAVKGPQPEPFGVGAPVGNVAAAAH